LRRSTVAVLAALLSLTAIGYSQPPTLLLTPQRLKRLKRDRERQTVRWTDFETRVQTVPDSPERGFELALYYAVTGDQTRGREAVKWAIEHPCELRQVALVRNWIGVGQEAIKPCGYIGNGSPVSARNSLFLILAFGGNTNFETFWRQSVLPNLEANVLSDPKQLYAACEFLMAYRAAERADLREDAAHFFSNLPTEFLLSLKPDKAEHPDWMTHIAALALVAMDPNLQGSQFLQGWAMEDRQMIREGPGVAYELLWADPYLPGVGYQNLDPWVYDPDAGRLFARTDWTPEACWISISKASVENEHCPANWQNATAKFGHLMLIPMTGECAQLPQRNGNEFTILWKLPATQLITFSSAQEHHTAQADPAGMIQLGANVRGKACLPREGKR